MYRRTQYDLKMFVEVATLTDGACFGELALMNSKPRAATIVATTELHTSFLVKKDYQEIIGKAMKKSIDSLIDFLREVCAFKHLTNTTLQKLSYYIKEINYIRGHVVFKENDEVEGIYIVKEGEFEKTKLLHKKLNKNTKTF